MKITTTTFRGMTEDGRKVICTAGLNDLLQRWARTIPTLSLELRTAAALKIQDLISVAQVLIKGLRKILAAPVSEVCGYFTLYQSKSAREDQRAGKNC